MSAIVRCRLRSALQGGRESRVAFVGALLPGAAEDEASEDEEEGSEAGSPIRSLTMASALRDVVDAVSESSALRLTCECPLMLNVRPFPCRPAVGRWSGGVLDRLGWR